MQLNKQEIRNALYQGTATRLLRELTNSDEFVTATDHAFDKEKRMKDKYILTRFIAVYLLNNNKLLDDKGEAYYYMDDIDELLGKAMDYLNSADSKELKRVQSVVLKALNRSYSYCGKDAFRLMKNERKTPINMNVFETIMYCMTYVTDDDMERKEEIAESIRRFIISPAFRDNIGNHRDSEKKLNWRLQKAAEIGKRYSGR